MKKVLFMFLMVFTVFAVAACNGATTLAPTTAAPTTVAPTTQAPTTQAPTTAAPTTAAPTTGVQDTEAPVISGVDDITIYLNTVFDPMEGVSAIDNVDGDITDQITVTGIVDTTKQGTNFLKYSVTDQAGNKKEETRYVYVEVDPNLIGDEIVQNGDFSLGNAVWGFSLFEGAAGSFSVVNEVGVVTIDAASWGAAAPRLESNVIEFENGVTYEITFEAKADAARSINVQVGKLLPAAPWFVDYKPSQPQVFDLSTDWQTFSFKFTMNNVTGEGQLLLEHGTVTGGVGTANLATVVYYDNVVIVEATPDPDTAAPIISGAKDLTLETGAVYDPLAGVSAFDIVDGNIVLDSSNYVSDVDTSIPGEYSVVYTVSDAAGNIASLTIYITVVDLVFNDTDDITDGSFETTTTIVPEVQDTEENGYADITDPEIWYYYVAGWDGAAATFSVIGEAAVVEVTSVGGADWSVMLKQKGIELVTGQTYKISFTASSTVARDIMVKVSDNYGQTFSLTESAASYSFIFTYEGEYKDMERVMFMLGNMTNYFASTVTIDDVQLDILAQEELVVNGTFNDNGWSVWSQDWDQGSGIPTVTASIVNGEYVVTTDLLGDANWAIQLFQEGLVLETGKTYLITFDAKADTVREINAKLIADGEFFSTVVLTETMDTYTFEFIYTGASTVNGKLDFELGVIGASVAGTVTFDNIKFEEVESETVVAESDQVVNGTFDQVIGWSTWAQDWEPLAGVTIEQVGGQLLVDVTALGGANWGVQLFQENVTLIEGATYTVTFVAKSSVARDINFVLIDGNDAEFRETFDLTDEFATYTFTFTYNGTSTVGKLDFELGNISVASVPALVTFEEVNMYRNFNPQEDPVDPPAEEVWVGYGMTVVQTETEVTITYADTPGSWWDINAQGSLVEFDGTNNAIVFTITGEAGQGYTFKIEGGGVNKEVTHVASGLEEEVTLDLSSLTEAQRNGLNLVIIFSNTPGQSGTIVLHGWAYGTITPPAEEVWVGYGMTVDQTETEVTITYADTPTEWWTINAQGSLVEFDGTNNAIVFTITGEEGQGYTFKIEIAGTGVFREVTHIASGDQEEVILDLSSLTEAERNDLNLVIIFSNTPGQSGTIVLHGWAYGNVIPQLTTPFGVVVSATEIVWGAIPEASSFEVYIDGVVGSPFTVAAGNYAFNLAALSLDPGTYNITLKAIGDGVNYIDSNLTAVFEYVVASGPTQLTTSFGLVINVDTLQWGALPDASSFEIYVDGVMEATVTAGTYSFDLTTLGLASGGAAIYDIQIKAIGDGVDFTDSELSAVVEYVIPE